MRILLAINTVVPAPLYGGTQRVVWWLGKALKAQGHQVGLLGPQGCSWPFGAHYPWLPSMLLPPLVLAQYEVLHLHCLLPEGADAPVPMPHIYTIHGNGRPGEVFSRQAVFLSANHAARHGATNYVHNGLDPDDYPDPPNAAAPFVRRHLLFLGKASRKEKNLAGAMAVARMARVPLVVAGGKALPRPGVRFVGMAGGEPKNALLRNAHALLMPVRWHEPFGLALIEAMWYGTPVLGTPYGSLPALVPPLVGFLDARARRHAVVARQLSQASNALFETMRCHEWVAGHLLNTHMARGYLALYEGVANGAWLHEAKPMAELVDPTVPAATDPHRLPWVE